MYTSHVTGTSLCMSVPHIFVVTKSKGEKKYNYNQILHIEKTQTSFINSDFPSDFLSPQNISATLQWSISQKIKKNNKKCW